MRDRLASLTVLSHQTVGCVGDGFYKAPEEVEGGQEALCAKLVAELEKNESKLTLQNHSSSSRNSWITVGTMVTTKVPSFSAALLG